MKKKKTIIIISVILGVLVLTLGVTFAIFTFNRTSSNSKLVVGDIYMHYLEADDGITLTNQMPSDTYDSNIFFEFTIDGKNTYEKNDIYYELLLNLGDDIEGKTRIKNNLLKFRLTEIIDNVETEIFTDKSYDDLTNKRIHVDTIPKNTLTEIEHTYRLYMWISSDTKICSGELTTGCDYYINGTTPNWSDVFASIKVGATGDFEEKTMVKNSATFKEYAISKQTDACQTYIEERGITYLSGTKDCVNFNYVWYSGKLWRITAINSDGTMKMITDDLITTISYNSDSDEYFYNISKKSDSNYTGSYVYQFLNEDFLDTLYNYENILVTDSTWYLITNSDITTKIPALNGTKIINNSAINRNTPVGLLNSYEYYLSYKNTNSSLGYLNNGYIWWLLNPNRSTSIWIVTPTGNNNSFTIGSNCGIRPSVNLRSDIQFIGGTGTKDNPYKIAGDKENATPNTTYLNTRTSGEYVIFDEDGSVSTKELYRIVSIDGETIKLNKNDYIKSGTTPLTKQFSTSQAYGNGNSDEYWDYYLNNTWYNSLANKYMLENSTYYTKIMTGGSYKNSLCKTDNTSEITKSCTKTTSVWNGLIGLPRYGEMFASQQGSGYNSSNNIFLITPYDSFDVWEVLGNGNNYNNSLSNVDAVRPSITLKSNIVITGGDGTKTNPFTIALK